MRKKYSTFRVQDYDQIRDNITKLKEMGDYIEKFTDKNYTYVSEGEEEFEEKNLSLDKDIEMSICQDKVY